MGTVPGAALIGRADELDRLKECCRGIAGGSGALVLLDGEAGFGKTRLVAELMKAPFLPRGYVAVTAGALDYARAPYAPVRDLLVALDKRFPKVLAANAALATALRPVLEFRRLESESSEPGDQRRMLDAIVSAFDTYATAAPVVLAVEDAHWIDAASADVLVHVARNIPGLRAMMLVSYRPAEAAENQSRHVLAQLARAATLSLSLRPLPAADAMVLIDDAAPADLPMNVRRHICTIAGGNPLLLLELTKLAVEHPQQLHSALPVTLSALVQERLSRFDETDVDILRIAAEMGEFEPDVLAEISGAGRDRVLVTLRKARNASIVEERRYGAPFVFRHALIRQAITEDLLQIDRCALHSRIGARLECLEQSPQLHARLAHHFWHAGQREKSRRYNELAAREAMRVYAFADAVLLYERCIDGREVCEESFALYRNLADAFLGAHRVTEASQLLQRLFDYAVAQGDAEAIADLGFELSRSRYQMLRDESAIVAIRRTLPLVDATSYPKLAFNLQATLAWYCMYARRIDEGSEPLQKARALFEHGDPPAVIRYYEASAAFKVHAHRDVKGYREDLEEGLRVAQGQSAGAYLKRLENAIALSLASSIDDMEFTLELCTRVRESAGSCPAHVAATPCSLAAWPFFLSGDFKAAQELIARALPAAEELPLVSFNLARSGIPLALHLDDPLLLRRVARPRLLENAFAADAPNVFGPVAAAVAQQFRRQKRAGEATALVSQAIKRIPAADNNIPLLLEAAQLDSIETAERAMHLLDGLREVSRSARAAWHMCSAFGAHGEARREHAQTAARLFGEIRWTVYQAEALELAGRQAEALELYARMGSAAGMKRLQEVRSARTASGLSPREWEVANLVARGRSNRAIADDLVLSERTVENHIASIFAKLSLRSRSEIAAFVTRSSASQSEGPASSRATIP